MKKAWYCLAGLLFMVFALIIGGCGDLNTQGSSTSSGTISAPSGTVAAGTSLTKPAGVSSLTFNSASNLTDSNGALVTGTITTNVTWTTDASSLPLAAPTGTSLAALLNITMNNGTLTVKNLSTPLTATVAVAGGATSVDVYSFDPLNSTWVLAQAGVPVSGGFATFSITHFSYWACFSITPLTITTSSPLPAGTVGTAYGVSLAATGGKGSYAWSGTPPAGLSLSTAGVITGTPTAAGTSAFTVIVADSASPANIANKQFSITINPVGGLAAPTNVVATGGTNSEIITWTGVTGATSYNIYWSATSGVTTANGTKITGVTSPYTHSRLTATPTWLAANTPYYYIVTAVNGAGESAASSPQATATTSAIDGVALYAANCQGCHNALPSSTHQGASAAQIQTGIDNNSGGMGTRFNATTGTTPLSPAQVQALSVVMATGF